MKQITLIALLLLCWAGIGYTQQRTDLLNWFTPSNHSQWIGTHSLNWFTPPINSRWIGHTRQGTNQPPTTSREPIPLSQEDLIGITKGLVKEFSRLFSGMRETPPVLVIKVSGVSTKLPLEMKVAIPSYPAIKCAGKCGKTSDTSGQSKPTSEPQGVPGESKGILRVLLVSKLTLTKILPFPISTPPGPYKTHGIETYLRHSPQRTKSALLIDTEGEQLEGVAAHLEFLRRIPEGFQASLTTYEATWITGVSQHDLLLSRQKDGNWLVGIFRSTIYL